jgi:hypothetical protein
LSSGASSGAIGSRYFALDCFPLAHLCLASRANLAHIASQPVRPIVGCASRFAV